MKICVKVFDFVLAIEEFNPLVAKQLLICQLRLLCKFLKTDSHGYQGNEHNRILPKTLIDMFR